MRGDAGARVTPKPPALPPALEPLDLSILVAGGPLRVSGALLAGGEVPPSCAPGLLVEESRLQTVTVAPADSPGLLISDAVLIGCDLSNVAARGGSLRRVEVRDCRLVGFALNEGKAVDLRVSDTTLAYASFAFSKLERVVFERVILREATFLQASLAGVEFIGCDLAGADFRGAAMSSCTVRGSTLEGVVGVESMRGLTMPWADLLASAAALAGALGIAIEPEP